MPISVSSSLGGDLGFQYASIAWIGKQDLPTGAMDPFFPGRSVTKSAFRRTPGLVAGAPEERRGEAMKATVKEAGKVRIIDLKGRITLGAGDLELRKAVQDQLDKGNTSVVLNLQGIEYIDSAGLGELVACKKRATAKGGDVKLVMPSESVYKVLSIVSLHLVFEIFDSEAKAIGSF